MPAVLPTDVTSLTALLHSVITAHDASSEKAFGYIAHPFGQFPPARRRMFGSSSEQSSNQGRLFDAAQLLAVATTWAQDVAPLAPVSTESEVKLKPARDKRAPLPPELPRVNVIHDVSEAERICCAGPMVPIGQDVSERLDIVPTRVRVPRHIRRRYGCAAGAHAPVTVALPRKRCPRPTPAPTSSPCC